MTSNFNILDMRVLHFEKLLPRHGVHGSTAQKKTESDAGRVYQRFCSLGYYDQMSYVRAKDEESILDYKHCFLIKYPYQQSEQRMVTDQMFTLLNEECDNGRDPFETDETEELPFLGIILLTVGKKLRTEDEERTGSIYQKLLETYKNACLDILDETMGDALQKGCYCLFYTPNCADLCIVIRTDNLQDIYDVKERLSAKNLSEIDGSVCHTSSYTLFQLPDRKWSEELIEKNKDLWLELRLYASEFVMEKIMGCLTGEDGQKGNVYGITGSGQYALELDFATFASVYPFIWQIKVGWDEEADACGERKTELQKLFGEYFSSLRCSYMRVKYCPQFSGKSFGNNMNGLCMEDWGLVEKYENDVIDFTKNKIKNGSYQVSSLKERKVMLRELYYTYNDFWFRQSSWWKGIVFYAQLNAIMEGVSQYEKMAMELSTSPEKLIQQTTRDLEQAIFSVNNFNKLLQSVNQYVVNIPNYEIQTKVNIEKYLMAYTMYLFEISSNYYWEHYTAEKESKDKDSETDIERILPFFLLDFNASKIEAYVLFGKKTMMADYKDHKTKEGIKEDGRKEDAPWTTLVAVKCPNYQWFANVYHVLPMITHEMSHNFRYLPRKDRNEFVFKYIITHLSKYMMEEILEESGIACKKLHYSNRERFFLEHIKEVIEKKLEGYIDQNAEQMRLKDLGVYLRMEFIKKITDKDEYNYPNYQTYNVIYEELLQLYKLTRTPYITPQDLEDDSLDWKGDRLKGQEVFFNILLDLLQPGNNNEKAEEWSKAIEKLDLTVACKDNRSILNSTKKILNVYKDQGVSRGYIFFLLTKTVGIWERHDAQIQRLKETDEEIRNIMEALEKREIFKAQRLFNDRSGKMQCSDESSNIRVDTQTEYSEKLSEFIYSYGKICTSIWNNDINVITSERPEDSEKTFAEDLHTSFHEGYQKLLNSRHSHENQWITYQKNQKLLTSLGIINGDPEQFVGNYQRIICKISEEEIQKIINDQIQNYEEIFADYGMCKAFSFTAYGYFMYCIHIFMKERDVPQKRLNNLTADRIRTLLLSLYREEVEDHTFDKALQDFWEDLKKALQIHKEELPKGYGMLCKEKSFKDFTQEKFNEFAQFKGDEGSRENIEEKSNGQPERELYKQVWILRWVSFLYRSLQLDTELQNEEDHLLNDLYAHVLEVDKTVGRSSRESGMELWIQRCRADENIQDIGDYYNHYKYSAVMADTRNGRCLKHQNQFVFDYYRRMFDCTQSVKSQLNRPENRSKDILRLLFEYHYNNS